MTISQGFLDALVSPRRAPELADADDIFDFLIASWDLEAVLYSTPIRWRYVTIQPTCFHYTAERLRDQDTWQLYLELFGKRS